MGTLNAFYVRIGPSQSRDLLLGSCPEAYTEEGSEYYAVEMPEDHFDVPTARLLQLSVDLGTSVIWLQFQSAVDSFHYCHWDRGAVVRTLVYGCFEMERTWERIEGASEAWESSTFFDAKELSRLLADFEDDEEQSRLKVIWSQEVLEVGSEFPMLDSRETARKVAEFYRLPGWGIRENEA